MSAVDIATLKARAEKSRDITVTTGNGWSFNLRRPSDMVLRDVLSSTAAREQPAQFQAQQVYAALRGWTGPSVGDVDPDATPDTASLPLPFAAELFDALFGDRTNLLDEIGKQLLDGYMQRLAARAGEQKNSQTSPPPVPS